MKSASGSITLKKATRKDIKEITELIYITEPEPELEWGYGSEKERKQVLEHLIKIKNLVLLHLCFLQHLLLLYLY